MEKYTEIFSNVINRKSVPGPRTILEMEKGQNLKGFLHIPEEIELTRMYKKIKRHEKKTSKRDK